MVTSIAAAVVALTMGTTRAFQPIVLQARTSARRSLCLFRSTNYAPRQRVPVLCMAESDDEEEENGGNFLGGLLKNAFANDENLSRSDFREGQLEGPGDDNDIDITRPTPKTEVQKRWLEAERRREESKTGATGTAPVPSERLEGTVWELQLYLAGISETVDDGSSSAPRPPEVKTPTVAVRVTLLSNNTCLVDPSPFSKPTTVDGNNDDEDVSAWGVASDSGGGSLVQFTFPVVGYVRTVTTTGTRSGVSWSRLEREAQTQQSQRRFIIPPGPLQGQFPVIYGSEPGQLTSPSKGPLFVERRLGLFGWGSKMEECGQVEASMIVVQDKQAEESTIATAEEEDIGSTNQSVSEEPSSAARQI